MRTDRHGHKRQRYRGQQQVVSKYAHYKSTNLPLSIIWKCIMYFKSLLYAALTNLNNFKISNIYKKKVWKVILVVIRRNIHRASYFNVTAFVPRNRSSNSYYLIISCKRYTNYLFYIYKTCLCANWVKVFTVYKIIGQKNFSLYIGGS